ncbi:hypothetical protein GJV77_05200 [Myroides pelagicus]|uniref:Uncharacterized protein n=2 Tax=Myroides pelagicus TaxID=270914 RepID=A0A7K1GKB8_9FLAO|nr:hypothetical protein [Myroides pelagicus]
MNVTIVVIGVVVIAILVLRRYFTVNRFNSTEEYLTNKEKELEEEEWEDELMDKESFNFLFLGFIATLLFLIVGLFTGNDLYWNMILFLITAFLFLHYLPPNNKF